MSPTNPGSQFPYAPFLSSVKLLSSGKMVVIRFFDSEAGVGVTFEYKGHDIDTVSREEMEEAERLAEAILLKDNGEQMEIGGRKICHGSADGRNQLKRFLDGQPVDWDKPKP